MSTFNVRPHTSACCLLAFALSTSIVSSAGAVLCSNIGAQDLQDSYWMWDPVGGLKCNATLANQIVEEFGFEKDYWDEGWGWEDACNIWLPLGRTLNAHFALGFSATDTSVCDYSKPTTTWALCWAAGRIKKSRVACAFDASATTSGTTVTYKMPFFFSQDVISRAGTIFHEARHSGGDCSHNAGTSCPAKGSCDYSWTDGCDGSGNYSGANRYKAIFLKDYLRYGTKGTPDQRDLAYAEANSILMTRFHVTPCHRYLPDGLGMYVC